MNEKTNEIPTAELIGNTIAELKPNLEKAQV